MSKSWECSSQSSIEINLLVPNHLANFLWNIWLRRSIKLSLHVPHTWSKTLESLDPQTPLMFSMTFQDCSCDGLGSQHRWFFYVLFIAVHVLPRSLATLATDKGWTLDIKSIHSEHEQHRVGVWNEFPPLQGTVAHKINSIQSQPVVWQFDLINSRMHSANTVYVKCCLTYGIPLGCWGWGSGCRTRTY